MYRVDYAKGAFCAAVAGACASDNDPVSGFFQNPAALLSGKPDLIFDADFNPSDNSEPGMKVGDQINDTTYMAGIGVDRSVWGLALAASVRQSEVKARASFYDDTGRLYGVQTTDSNTALFLNIPFAYRISQALRIGVGVTGLYYHESIQVDGGPEAKTSANDSLPQFGLTGGFQWSLNPNLQIGSWVRTPVSFSVNQKMKVSFIGGNEIDIDDQVQVHYPMIWAFGASVMPWGDKRVFLVDIDVIGTTYKGYERTLDTFQSAADDRTLRPKGRFAVIEPHLAWRSPWWTGSSGTYSIGAYYENSRWKDLSGRAHAVAGISYDFNMIETVLSTDIARDYFSFQFSFR